jgi:hypothetical protein
MASLRELNQTNPNTVVYDERTKQYHDIANRYRMVKRTVIEAMQNAIPTGTPTRNNDGSVSQTTFDAFRKDVYFHISETARLTKIGLEELKKSLDYQTKETNRLQRLVNQTDEDRQENKIERIYDERDVRSDRRRSRMSFGGILGLGAVGLLGSFLLSSMFMSQEQIREFGESIDNVIGMLPDVENVIDNFNRISNALQSVLDFFSPSETSERGPAELGTPEAQTALGGTEGQPPINEGEVAVAYGAEIAGGASAAHALRQQIQAGQRSELEPENAGNRMRAAAAAAAPTHSRVTRTDPGRQQQREQEELRGEQIERSPEAPERAISGILFDAETLDQIRQMRQRQGAYSGMTADQIQARIVSMIDSTLQGADRLNLANRVRSAIGDHPDLHGSAEVASQLIESSDQIGTTEAARRLYEIFYDPRVIGERRGQFRVIQDQLYNSRLTRSNRLRENIRRLQPNRQVASLNPQQFVPQGGGTTVSIEPTLRIPGGRFPGTPAQPLQAALPPGRPPENRTRTPDGSFAAFQRSMGMMNA